MTVHAIQVVSSTTQSSNPKHISSQGNPPEMLTAVQERVNDVLLANRSEVLPEQNGGACPDWQIERSYGTVPSDV